MTDWKEYVRTHYIPNKYGTERLSADTGIPSITIRRYISKGMPLDNPPSKPAPKATTDQITTLIGLLAKGGTIESIADRLSVSENVTRAHIADLRDRGYCIDDRDDYFKLTKTVNPTISNIVKRDWDGDTRIRFGVISDPHFGSKYAQYTLLHRTFDIFRQEGITTVRCPGDITEGWKMRPGHEHEVHAFGADEQVDFAVKVWPDNGIVTEFITGNHDASHIRNGGIDVGRMIAARRKDMNYLGMANAKVYLTPNCSVELNHPLDGASYALSYAPQKTIDAMSGGDKPSILLNGHHHKMFYMLYRNIHALECGTLEAQTPWMLGKRIAANVGGWIVEVHVNDTGEVTRFIPEAIPFYKTEKEDWRNYV